jgi:eukaryotic-like serine/threonine-protein kinase
MANPDLTSDSPPPINQGDTPTAGNTGELSPSLADPAAVASALRDRPGSRIGPYLLLHQIGEGGFGSVFLAEQERPVARKVALKIIKLGMDTGQVVARFEQERQALAILNHPNIAKVFDAGATDAGRPYFVMELCTGEPIDIYCDRQRLSIPERLELVAQVCAAVQHAHSKGLIHRDIKPSNILVGTVDGHANAKVIDFGIAKATGPRLSDQTLFTEHRQLIGTPEYMSPEQAEGSMDIDTRTDIYSLGVLLYELLTGSTPFDAKLLRSASYAELQRIIRDVDPPRPSTRLSKSGDTIGGVAAHRRTDPRRLNSALRAELDWIVLKAMEKDRTRRYETANGLAQDIRRYLAGEVVEAAPPGAGYRARKFIRRNRVMVSAVGAVTVSLLIGLVGFAWQARVANDEKNRALRAESETAERADELQKVSDFQASLLSSIDVTAAGEKLVKDIGERYAKALEAAGVPAEDRPARMQAFAKEVGLINATDTAASLIDHTILSRSIKAIGEEFKEQPAVDAALRHSLAEVYHALGLDETAIELAANAAETRRRVLGDDDPKTLAARARLAGLLHGVGKSEEAISIGRDASGCWGLSKFRRSMPCRRLATSCAVRAISPRQSPCFVAPLTAIGAYAAILMQ